MTGSMSKGGQNCMEVYTIVNGAYNTKVITFDGIISTQFSGAAGDVGFEISLDQVRNDADVASFVSTYAKSEAATASEIITFEDGTEVSSNSASMPAVGIISYVSHASGHVQTFLAGVSVVADSGFSTSATATTKRAIKVKSVKAPSTITIGSDLFDTSIITVGGTGNAITGDVTIPTSQSGTELWADEATS